MVTNLVTKHLGFTADAKEADKAACCQLSCVGWCSHWDARILLKWEERMYPGYQPKPADVFHAVGYTTRYISDNTHFRLHGISDLVRMENENLWRQPGPLLRAMHPATHHPHSTSPIPTPPLLHT